MEQTTIILITGAGVSALAIIMFYVKTTLTTSRCVECSCLGCLKLKNKPINEKTLVDYESNMHPPHTNAPSQYQVHRTSTHQHNNPH